MLPASCCGRGSCTPGALVHVETAVSLAATRLDAHRNIPLPRLPVLLAGRPPGRHKRVHKAQRRVHSEHRAHTGAPEPHPRARGGAGCTVTSSAWPVWLLHMRKCTFAERGRSGPGPRGSVGPCGHVLKPSLLPQPQGNTPVLGVVHVPVSGDTYYAVQGRGAYVRRKVRGTLAAVRAQRCAPNCMSAVHGDRLPVTHTHTQHARNTHAGCHLSDISGVLQRAAEGCHNRGLGVPRQPRDAGASARLLGAVCCKAQGYGGDGQPWH